MFLAPSPRRREEILTLLGIGLRTFYRDLRFLKKCGIAASIVGKAYRLDSTAESAEGMLPFPDPRLSFTEALELSRCPGEAGRRIAELLERVVQHPGTAARMPRAVQPENPAQRAS